MGSASSYVAFKTNCFHVKNVADLRSSHTVELMITPNKYFGLWKNQVWFSTITLIAV